MALRVLDPFLRDENLLVEFWRSATEEPRKAWSSCHLPYRWIATKPVARGYAVNAELRYCGTDLSGVEQSPCEVYDRIEIPKIAPDVTRVLPHGGVCLCCAVRFKVAPPEGLEPRSPFGPNRAAS